METAQITSSAAQLAVPTCATCPMVTLVPPAWAGARLQWLGVGSRSTGLGEEGRTQETGGQMEAWWERSGAALPLLSA